MERDARQDAGTEALKRIEEARSAGSESLDLSRLELTSIPDTIDQLTKLRGLILSGNQLTTIPDAIGRLTQLWHLDLSGNQLTKVPDAIGRLTQLVYLNLSRNQLTIVPDIIDRLTKLQGLILSGNQLAMIPGVVGRLTQLGHLDFSGNQLTTIPDAIGRLTHLRHLDVSGNQLAIVPDALGRLTQLQYLDLSGNQLTSIPGVVGRLTQLWHLDLSGNQLTTIPDAIGRLTHLRFFFLFENRLTAVPESTGGLTYLEALKLCKNNLTTIPDAIGRLTQLRQLDLSGNQLTRIPSTIGRLMQLRELNLDENRILELPETLRRLTKLERLYIHGNQDLGLPVEVLGPTVYDVARRSVLPRSPADILEYYFRIREGRRPLMEVKLVLVGFGGVGKTSIVNRLIRDHFDPIEAKTEGVNITDWPICLNSQENARLHVWDFGGQEIMHATHQFFLTQRTLYLLVLAGRQGREDADAEYWLNLIASFAADSPVIIILNKTKEHAFDINRGALRQKFSNVRDIIKTDCEDRTGLDELSKLIRRETDALPHLRDQFPAAWFAIKDRLSTMPDNYLTFDRYREICAENGERNREAQETLAGFLHSLGVALNYKDDPRLRDTHVLNPRWVTEGVYDILNHPRLSEQNGELHASDLTIMLNLGDYPLERHGFLLELMRKFELCFPFPEQQDYYLIPELLGKEQPNETNRFDLAACLNFEYHYPTLLPEGLLPRFIVRTYVLSADKPRWRSGVILQLEENCALVIGDPIGRRVHIAIDGPAASRRRLLAVIRSDFERIHSSYKFQPQEMAPVPGHPDVLISYAKLRAFEKSGKPTISEVIGDEVREFGVSDLLDGVDLEGIRPEALVGHRGAGAKRAFVSYSHKDDMLRAELETHLKLLSRQGLLDIWADRRITAGDEWKGEIDENLERADLILLLVSSDFIASDYCYDEEMGQALERHKKGTARVVPIIIRDCSWEIAPFGKLQALPKDGVPVAKKGRAKLTRDSTWKDVAKGIEGILKKMSTPGSSGLR